jgi:flagellar motor switch protein FliG
MVELIRAHDPEVCSKIELSMYDFFILSRQSEQTITRLLDEVPLEQWAIALKGAEPALRDAILNAMPRRQAQSFDELMRRSGPVPLSRVEQTRKDIMAAVKELSEAGQIEVQLYDEATAE